VVLAQVAAVAVVLLRDPPPEQRAPLDPVIAPEVITVIVEVITIVTITITTTTTIVPASTTMSYTTIIIT
jgi:hypothetical protein